MLYEKNKHVQIRGFKLVVFFSGEPFNPPSRSASVDEKEVANPSILVVYTKASAIEYIRILVPRD